jgi:hypothetical protein
MWRISTRTHGMLDYLTVGFALAFPRLLGCNRKFTNAVTSLALGKLGYAMLTRHELAPVKLIPMKAHLVMDCIGGAALCAIPFALDEEDDPAAIVCAMGMGLFDIAAAPMTETRASFDRALGAIDESEPPALPREVHVPETDSAVRIRGPLQNTPELQS